MIEKIKNLLDIEFYKNIKEKKIKGYKRLVVLLSFLFALIIGGIFYFTLGKSLIIQLNQAVVWVKKAYPADLVLTFENGILNSNINPIGDEFFIETKAGARPFSFILDTTKTSKELLQLHNKNFYVGNEGIFLVDIDTSGKIEGFTFQALRIPDTSIDKQKLETMLDKASGKFWIIGLLISISLFLFNFLGILLMYFLAPVLSGFIIFIFNKLSRNMNTDFVENYKIAFFLNILVMSFTLFINLFYIFPIFLLSIFVVAIWGIIITAKK